MTTLHTITFGALLRQYRMAAGLTQEELAEWAKLSVRAVSDLERGVRRLPHKDTLALLIGALGLSDEERTSLWEAVRSARQLQTAPTAPSTPSSPAPAGIPSSLTPLIGREREEAAIAHLLAHGDARLLTLTGPAGIGKTRLAQQVALDLRHAFADGAVFVPLVPVREPTLVLPAIAQALGVREEAGQSLLTPLQASLADRELLLVLDNFEHVAGAAGPVAALLTACPQVKALVTSRTALHVRGEQEFAVPPLDTPDLDHLPALKDLVRYAAIALFVRRAQAVRPTFTLSSELAPTVAAICVRLDGLPLAIELAAARIKLLSPHALLARLDSSLALLTRGPVDLPERHQTMRSAIAWSYDLLAAPEQRLFRRLAVFVGGWTLEAAEAIGEDGEDGDGAGPSMLDRLAALTDESLVMPGEGAGGTSRFRLLELIREYGLERLAATGEEAATRQRHADYYAAFAEAAEPHLRGDAQAIWLAHLAQEHANLRAALRWAEASGAVELGLRLSTALWWFWQVRGFKQEGRDWLERFLRLQQRVESEAGRTLRAEALRGAGNLAWSQGDFEPARTYLEDSLVLYRQLGNTRGHAYALNTLGLVADEQGEWDTAVALLEEALALFRELRETNYIAKAYNNLAVIAYRRQQYDTAIDLYEHSLALHRESGDAYSIALTLGNLGESLHLAGDLTRAASTLADSLALCEAVGDKEDMAFGLNNLASVVYEQGDLTRAARLLHRSLALAREVSAKRIVYAVLDGAADLAYDLGLVEQSARVLALSTALREKACVARSLGNQARCESRLALARASLSEPAFAAQWETGRLMTLDDAEALVAELAGEGGAGLAGPA